MADFTDGDLRGSRFENVDLSDAELRMVDLVDARFHAVDQRHLNTRGRQRQ